MASPQRGLSELSEQDRRVVEGWLAAFKQDWDERRLGTQVRRLPAEGPLRGVALAEMVKIDLKQQWQKGRRAKVEAYLKAFPELGTPETVRVDLVLAEYEARRQFGASASLEEFARRFPNQVEELGRRLASAPGTAAGATRDTRGPAPEDWPAQATRETRGQHSSTHPSARPSGAASLPEQFGRYRIIRELGRGGMGSVHLAHDTQLDRPVALKVPHFGPADGPAVLQRFQREARAAATIDHPNICPVHDVGEHEGVHFVTMAYIEGKPLSELIQGGKVLPPRQVAALVRKLALALHEAHKKGVVHRDLKPSNVMVNKRNEPVIMDFGLARRAQDARLTGTGAVMGTPAYMPPEQVQGDVEAMGPGCDIYSLGVMLYEMLTGRLPFEGPVTAVLGQILTQEPPRPRALRPDLDPELEAVCLKAMAKKIGDRFRSMAEFATALTRTLKKGEGGAGKPATDLPEAPVAGGPIPVAQVAPAGASTAGGEGLATELLARLVDRLEVSAAPAGQQPPAGGGTRWWVPLLVACALLLGGGILFYLATQREAPNIRVETTNTVVVQLQRLKEMNDPTIVVFIIEGKEYTREELPKEIRLETGEHELKIKRKDRPIETITFTVAKGDKEVDPFDKRLADRSKDRPDPPDPQPEPPKARKEEPVGEPSAAVKPLIAKLADEDNTVRRQTADTLREMGDKSAAPALADLVTNELWHDHDGYRYDSGSKVAALKALRALAPERVTGTLLDGLRARGENVRIWACEELAKQKDQESAAGLVAALKEDRSVAVRTAAATALGLVRPPAVRALAAALKDDENQVRCAAAKSLQKLGDQSRVSAGVARQVADGAAPALTGLVTNELWHDHDGNRYDSGSKVAALKALRALAPEQVTAALLDALRAKDENIRIWTCEELANQKDRESAAGLVATLKDPAEKVRAAAAAGLASVRPPAVQALVSALGDESNTVRCQAADSLRRLGDRSKMPADVVQRVVDGSAPALARRVADEVWHDHDGYRYQSGSKVAALKALRALAPEKVTAALLDALKAKDENIRIWACEELANQKDRESLDGLTAALKDRSQKVRATAAQALSRRK